MTRQRLSPATAVLLLLTLPLPAWGQGGVERDLTGRVDAFVTSEMARQKIPGVAVAVIEKGRVVLAKGYGLANVARRQLLLPVRQI